MQPYFLPYLGYFHLMHSVDVFVLYDDVQYVKDGWINRNRLLFGDATGTVTLPVKKDRSFQPINKRCVATSWTQTRLKHLRQIDQHYRLHDNFTQGLELYREISNHGSNNLVDVLRHGLACIADYLQLDTQIVASSDIVGLTKLRGTDRVKAICHAHGATHYINAIGGRALYDKDDFKNAGIELSFVGSQFPEYDQKRPGFVPGLSILDMILSIVAPDERENQLRAYELV